LRQRAGPERKRAATPTSGDAWGHGTARLGSHRPQARDGPHIFGLVEHATHWAGPQTGSCVHLPGPPRFCMRARKRNLAAGGFRPSVSMPGKAGPAQLDEVRGTRLWAGQRREVPAALRGGLIWTARHQSELLGRAPALFANPVFPARCFQTRPGLPRRFAVCAGGALGRPAGSKRFRRHTARPASGGRPEVGRRMPARAMGKWITARKRGGPGPLSWSDRAPSICTGRDQPAPWGGPGVRPGL